MNITVSQKYMKSLILIHFIFFPILYCPLSPYIPSKIKFDLNFSNMQILKIWILYYKSEKINFIREESLQNWSCSKWSKLLFQIFFYFDEISKIRPLEPKNHYFCPFFWKWPKMMYFFYSRGLIFEITSK